MEFIKTYWPSLVGASVLGFTAVALIPKETKEAEPDTGMIVIPKIPEPTADAVLEKDLAASRPKKPAAAAPLKKKESPGFELVETVQAVELEPEVSYKTVTEKDPAVQRALKKVKIEVIQTGDCESCAAARAFLSKNGLSYSVSDMKSNRVAKRAKELTGSSSVPILVVDGRAVVGFSQGSLQAALSAAARNRM